MDEKPGKDLVAGSLEDLSWAPNERMSSLEKVFKYVSGEAQQAIVWYLIKKDPKRKGARFLRFGAIVATTVAGLIPLLAEIFKVNGQPQISPAWASVALVLAVALIGLDRFFGFSTAWMRFLTTEIQIRTALQAFRLDWEIQRAAWKDPAPTDEQVQNMLARCKAFLTQVNKFLENEMVAWIQEFQATLQQIDKAATSQAEANHLGGATVSVSNGDQCDNGWELSIDDGNRLHYMGKTAALRDLVPGIHSIRVWGSINGKAAQAESVAIVPAGGTTRIELEVA
jgi:SMODS and SLOG-associating 2TM effector domain 2